MPSVTSSTAFSLGAGLLCFPLFSFVISAIGLWLGISIHGGASLAAAIMAGAVATGLKSGQLKLLRPMWHLRQRGSLLCLLVYTVILVVSIAISGWMYDLSWDGQAYHQEAIIQLMDGWNPFYEHNVPDPIGPDGDYNIWVDSYAKGYWMSAASLALLAGSIECGKAYSLILLLASGLLAFAALQRHLKLGWQAGVFAALLALSPIVCVQVESFYVDGPLGSLVLASLALMYISKRWPGYHTLMPLAGALMLLANIKLTGLAYAGMLTAAMMAWAAFSAKTAWTRTSILVLGVSFAFAIGLFGYQPYVINTVNHGHPFHPTMGRDRVGVIDGQINPYFRSRGQLEKALFSLFARTDNNLYTHPVLKRPFAWDEWEVKTLAAVDTRIGGFGPWYGPIAALSVLLLGVHLVTCRLFRSPAPAYQGALAGGVLTAIITAFSNPEAWWARFVPQLWFVAPLAIATVIASSRIFVLRAAGWLLTTLLVINLGMIIWSVSSSGLPATLRLHAQLRSIAAYTQMRGSVTAAFGFFPSNRLRLSEAGISWVSGSVGLQPIDATQLVGSDTMILLY